MRQNCASIAFMGDLCSALMGVWNKMPLNNNENEAPCYALIQFIAKIKMTYLVSLAVVYKGHVREQ